MENGARNKLTERALWTLCWYTKHVLLRPIIIYTQGAIYAHIYATQTDTPCLYENPATREDNFPIDE